MSKRKETRFPERANFPVNLGFLYYKGNQKTQEIFVEFRE